MELKAFPGNRVGNGIATKSATGCHFQNGSSICSVISTNPSGMLPGWLSLSVAAFSRSQPFCLPNPANILGFEKYRHLKVVYSREEAWKPSGWEEEAAALGKRQIPGSVSFVPGAAGLLLAGEVIRDLTGYSRM